MTPQTQPASAADVLRQVRAVVQTHWQAGDATDALLALRSEHGAMACILFTRATGKRIALFEDARPTHAEMLAAIDKTIALAEREAVA